MDPRKANFMDKEKNNTLEELGSISYALFGSAPSYMRWEHALFRSVTMLSTLLIPCFIAADPKYIRSLTGILQILVTLTGTTLLVLDAWYYHKNKKVLIKEFKQTLDDIKEKNILYFNVVKTDFALSRSIQKFIDIMTAFACGILIAHFYLGVF